MMESATTSRIGSGWRGTSPVGLLLFVGLLVAAPSESAASQNGEVFDQQIRPLLREYCLKCHSTEEQEGDLDLEVFTSIETVRKHPKIWQLVAEQLANNE